MCTGSLPMKPGASPVRLREIGTQTTLPSFPPSPACYARRRPETRYRARLLAVAQHALLALPQQVPGGIGNFHNAFHGFAVQALDWYLIDRELIAPFAQADFLPRAHMLNALVLSRTSADEELIAFAVNNGAQQHDTVERLAVLVKTCGGTVKTSLHTLMLHKERFQR